MSLGEDIDLLIRKHIELWHEATKIKDFNGNLIKDMSSEDRVKVFLNIRMLNSDRAQVRDKINKICNSGYPDPKINYTGASK